MSFMHREASRKAQTSTCIPGNLQTAAEGLAVQGQRASRSHPPLNISPGLSAHNSAPAGRTDIAEEPRPARGLILIGCTAVAGTGA